MNKSKRTLLPFLAIFLLILQIMNPIPVYADGEAPPDPPATEETPPPEDQTDPTEEALIEETSSAEQEGEAVETPTAEDTTPTEEPSAEATPSPEDTKATETSSVEETSTPEEPTATEEAPASEPVEEPALAPDETQSEEVNPPDEVPTEGEDLTVSEVLEQAPPETEIVIINEEGEIEPLATLEAEQIILEGDPMWCAQGSLPGNPGCTSAYATFAALVTELETGGYSGNGTIYVAYDYAGSEGQINLDHTSGDLIDLDDLTIQGGWDFGSNTMYSNDDTYQSTLDGTSLSIQNWVGNVTVNNIFINNADDIGLYVQTEGNINLDEVTVDDSALDGAVLDSGGNVEVTDSEFTDNGVNGYEDEDIDYYYYEAGDGLHVEAEGNVTLNNVYAAYNGGDGVDITSGGNVMVTSGEFEGNGFGFDLGAHFEEEYFGLYDDYFLYGEGGNGLFVDSTGDITLEDIESYENAGDGAALFGEGELTITGSDFYENGLLGTYSLEYYFDEDVTSYFAHFFFESHAGDGVYAEVAGDITLSDVFANWNQNNGATFETEDGEIEITNSEFNGNGWGMGIFEEDVSYIILEELLVGEEGDDSFCGILADEYIPYQPFIFDPCTQNDYIEVIAPNFEYHIDSMADEDGFQNYYTIYQSGGQGLEADTEYGSITMEDLEASYNSADGAHLHGYDNVSLTNGYFEENGFLAAEFNFGECYGEGLNDCAGLESDNAIAGFLEFDYGNGLYVNSIDGDVTLNSVFVLDNADDGAIIKSYDGSVFIDTSTFSYNGEDVLIGGEDGLFGKFLYHMLGLDFEILLPVSELYFDFAFAENYDFFFVEAETDFSSGTGLDVYGDTGITLNQVYTFGNMGDGTYLFTPANILVTESDFSSNGEGFSGYGGLELYLDESEEFLDAEFEIYNGNGMYAEAGGDITLSEVVANDNVVYGAELYSDATDSVLVEYSQFNDNGYGGPLGNGIWAYGYYLVDESGTESDLIVNYGSGLYIDSAGNVTLNYVEANNNYLHGAEVYSDGGRVIVNCGTYDNNGYGDEGGYGVYEQGASSLELYGPEILNNFYSPDEYFFSNSLVISDDCLVPAPIISTAISSGHRQSSESLACTEGEYYIRLENGDWVAFPCPINDIAYTQSLLEEELPAPLPDDEYHFHSALDTDLLRDGRFIDLTDREVLVSFLIPDGIDPETLSILYWNDGEWIELKGEITEIGPNGEVFEGKLYYQISTLYIGTFVLVTN